MCLAAAHSSSRLTSGLTWVCPLSPRDRSLSSRVLCLFWSFLTLLIRNVRQERVHFCFKNMLRTYTRLKFIQELYFPLVFKMRSTCTVSNISNAISFTFHISRSSWKKRKEAKTKTKNSRISNMYIECHVYLPIEILYHVT